MIDSLGFSGRESKTAGTKCIHICEENWQYFTYPKELESQSAEDPD